MLSELIDFISSSESVNWSTFKFCTRRSWLFDFGMTARPCWTAQRSRICAFAAYPACHK